MTTDTPQPTTELHFMIDIETLDVCDDALILSIAAVKFTKDEILDSMVLYPDFEDRKIGVQTLKWWMINPQELGRLLDLNRKSAQFIYNQLAYFLSCEQSKPTIWAKSPSFDLDILKSYFHRFNPLWKYDQEADVRTAYLKLRQKQIELIPSDQPHEALADAIAQAKNIQVFLQL